jgi:quercetin dioxygenase-like cupin family protein
MEIEARQPTSKGPAERFTGDVWVDMVAQPRPLPHRMTAGIVRFAPGSRTAWHLHVLGQTLRVTDGVALVQVRGGQAVAVYPGPFPRGRAGGHLGRPRHRHGLPDRRPSTP